MLTDMYFLQIFHCDAFGGWSKLLAFVVLVSSVQFNIINAPFYIIFGLPMLQT
jgi:hypothetical protein